MLTDELNLMYFKQDYTIQKQPAETNEIYISYMLLFYGNFTFNIFSKVSASDLTFEACHMRPSS